MISVTVPFPPSVNHLYGNRRRGGKFIKPAGRQFRNDVAVMCLQSHVRTTGKVALTIHAYPPDNRRRDLDNLLKALLDALQAAGAIENDNLIRKLSIEWCHIRTGGMVMVDIERL